VANSTTIATPKDTSGPHPLGQARVSAAIATKAATTHPMSSTSWVTHQGTAAAVHRSMRESSNVGAPGRLTATGPL
jgi:hypothetical protein